MVLWIKKLLSTVEGIEMKNNILLTTTFVGLLFSGSVFAQDLSGTWQQIDDKTGSPKALI